jgi:tetratricopeptide (TPR) repeat protein
MVFIIILAAALSLSADAVYTKNKKANTLYDAGNYDEALKLYEDALLESPGNKKLQMNKGSALYRLGQLDKAEESYKNSQTIEDQKARAAALYNLGNTYNSEGDQLAMAQNQQAMEKYKAARDSYIKALDVRPNDKDAKWNLQITQMKIKQMEQQQKQQQQNDKNQDKQDKNKQQNQQNQQNQDQNKKDNKQDQQQQNKEQQNKEQKEQQDQQQDQSKEKPAPQPQEDKKKEMEQKEALQLLMQYSDDAKDLNKPQKKMKVIGQKKPEKDW